MNAPIINLPHILRAESPRDLTLEERQEMAAYTSAIADLMSARERLRPYAEDNHDVWGIIEDIAGQIAMLQGCIGVVERRPDEECV